MRFISEKIKVPKEKSDQKQKQVNAQPEVEEVELTREEKLAKLKRLQALQEELEALKIKETQITQPSSNSSVTEKKDADGLEILESEISKGIQSATKGELLAKVKIDEKSVERELAILEQEVATEKIQKVIEKSPYEKLLGIHEWLEQAQYGFMYIIPNRKKNKQDYESWREEWSQVLFDYAKVGKFHIIYIKRLLTEKPFNKFDKRKKAVLTLAERLVEKELAEWTGEKPRKKEELRIYWKSLGEWQDIMLHWAEENAILELIMIPDIRKSKTDFANLPIHDLKKIFKKIEKEKKGQMVELENDQFGIKFNIF